MLSVVSVALSLFVSCSGQQADSSFNATVAHPAVSGMNHQILFDEAHNNIHTTSGTYKPFVDLVTADGYKVLSNGDEFSLSSLQGYDILVISNAKGNDNKYDPAFTQAECDAVEEWVRNGGSLLLIADHYPFGSASKQLAGSFGVDMRDGFTNDSLHADSPTGSFMDGNSQLIFSRDDHLLADHPIIHGRDSSEQVDRIITFTGQSLLGPEGSSAILQLAPTAYDIVPDSIWHSTEFLFFTNTHTRFDGPVSAVGRAQGIALEFGKGRVVVLGEAAMLTAQRFEEERFGMNVPGIDNKQFALNVMHWLSRIL